MNRNPSVVNNNILKQLYKNGETVSEDVKSIDTTLGKILKLQKEEVKFDEKVERERKAEKNKEERDAKRKRADMFKKVKIEKVAGAKQVEKNGNLFEKLLGGLGSILGSIKDVLGGIGGLITGGFTGLGIGTAIAGALGGIVGLIKPVIGTLVKGMTTLIGKSLVPIKTAIGALVGKAGGWAALGLASLKGLLLGTAAAAPVAIAAGMGVVYDTTRRNMAGGGVAGDTVREIDRLQGELRNNRGRLATPEAKAEDARLQQIKDEIFASNDQKNKEIREATTYDSRGRETYQDEEAVSKATAAHEARVAEIRKRFENPVKRQLGGHINVPGYGEGDKVPMLLPEGSFVLNKMASMHFQTGGMVPTLLEPGEKVFMPGDWDSSISMLNDMIPRFQTGGEVSSILSAAESSIGLSQGVGEQCANTTRAVLKAAGHPQAGKATQIGDLDPDGTAYNGLGFAASFAGSDMGSVNKDFSAVKPGEIMLWRDTYGNFTPGAITHVGIAGKGNTQYDHSRSRGWEKVSRESHKFAASINLNGTGGGGGDGGGTADRGGSNDNVLSGILGGIGDSAKFLVEGTGAFMEGFNTGFKSKTGFGVGDIFGPIGGGISSLFSGLGNMFNLGGDKEQTGSGDTSSGGASHSAVTGEASGDMMQGARLIMKAGVPKLGASYLAGNIQQESSWNGQRSWGGVYNPSTGQMDGTSRNGGLVSWASWKDDPARLGKIEEYLGKNIAKASDAEQINAMMWEMKNHYPGAYATFMNPKSTPAELRSASKTYWGYGHEGARYQYAEQIMQQMKQNGGVVRRQQGGVVNRANSPIMDRMRQAQASMEQMVAASANPIVIYEDAPPIKVSSPAAVSLMPPSLPEGPGSAMASDYFYQLSLGAQ